MRKVFAFVVASLFSIAYSMFLSGVFFEFDYERAGRVFLDDPLGFVLYIIALMSLSTLFLGIHIYGFIAKK